MKTRRGRKLWTLLVTVAAVFALCVSASASGTTNPITPTDGSWSIYVTNVDDCTTTVTSLNAAVGDLNGCDKTITSISVTSGEHTLTTAPENNAEITVATDATLTVATSSGATYVHGNGGALIVTSGTVYVYGTFSSITNSSGTIYTYNNNSLTYSTGSVCLYGGTTGTVTLNDTASACLHATVSKVVGNTTGTLTAKNFATNIQGKFGSVSTETDNGSTTLSGNTTITGALNTGNGSVIGGGYSLHMGGGTANLANLAGTFSALRVCGGTVYNSGTVTNNLVYVADDATYYNTTSGSTATATTAVYSSGGVRYAKGTFAGLSGSYTQAEDLTVYNSGAGFACTETGHANSNDGACLDVTGANYDLALGDTTYTSGLCAHIHGTFDDVVVYDTDTEVYVGNTSAFNTDNHELMDTSAQSFTINSGAVNVLGDLTVRGSTAGIDVHGTNAVLNIGGGRQANETTQYAHPVLTDGEVYTPEITNTTTGSSTGIRVGVTVVGGVVNMYNGTIWLEPDNGGSVYGISTSGGTTTVRDGLIEVNGSNNNTTMLRGIQVSGGTVHFIDGTIKTNGNHGRGISILDGTFTMGNQLGTTPMIDNVGGNSAVGIYSEGGSSTVFSGEVYMRAGNSGVGIQVAQGGNLEVHAGDSVGADADQCVYVHTNLYGAYAFQTDSAAMWAIRGRNAIFDAPLSALYVANAAGRDENGRYPLSGGTFFSTDGGNAIEVVRDGGKVEDLLLYNHYIRDDSQFVNFEEVDGDMVAEIDSDFTDATDGEYGIAVADYNSTRFLKGKVYTVTDAEWELKAQMSGSYDASGTNYMIPQGIVRTADTIRLGVNQGVWGILSDVGAVNVSGSGHTLGLAGRKLVYDGLKYNGTSGFTSTPRTVAADGDYAAVVKVDGKAAYLEVADIDFTTMTDDERDSAVWPCVGGGTIEYLSANPGTVTCAVSLSGETNTQGTMAKLRLYSGTVKDAVDLYANGVNQTNGSLGLGEMEYDEANGSFNPAPAANLTILGGISQNVGNAEGNQADGVTNYAVYTTGTDSELYVVSGTIGDAEGALYGGDVGIYFAGGYGEIYGGEIYGSWPQHDKTASHATVRSGIGVLVADGDLEIYGGELYGEYNATDGLKGTSLEVTGGTCFLNEETDHYAGNVTVSGSGELYVGMDPDADKISGDSVISGVLTATDGTTYFYDGTVVGDTNVSTTDGTTEFYVNDGKFAALSVDTAHYTDVANLSEYVQLHGGTYDSVTLNNNPTTGTAVIGDIIPMLDDVENPYNRYNHYVTRNETTAGVTTSKVLNQNGGNDYTVAVGEVNIDNAAALPGSETEGTTYTYTVRDAADEFVSWLKSSTTASTQDFILHQDIWLGNNSGASCDIFDCATDGDSLPIVVGSGTHKLNMNGYDVEGESDGALFEVNNANTTLNVKAVVTEDDDECFYYSTIENTFTPNDGEDPKILNVSNGNVVLTAIDLDSNATGINISGGIVTYTGPKADDNYDEDAFGVLDASDYGVKISGGTFNLSGGNGDDLDGCKIRAEVGILATAGTVNISGNAAICADEIAVDVSGTAVLNVSGSPTIGINDISAAEFAETAIAASGTANVTISGSPIIVAENSITAKALNFTSSGTLNISGGSILGVGIPAVGVENANATVNISGGLIGAVTEDQIGERGLVLANYKNASLTGGIYQSIEVAKPTVEATETTPEINYFLSDVIASNTTVADKSNTTGTLAAGSVKLTDAQKAAIKTLNSTDNSVTDTTAMYKLTTTYGGGNGGGGSVAPVLNIKDHFAYLTGFTDGTFRPDGNLTRAQAAAIFYRLLDNKTISSKTAFKDVDASCWAYDQIMALAERGVITGYADGTFRPNGNITRAQFCAIASRFFDLKQGTISYTDVPATYWAYKYIASAAGYGWIDASAKTFRPGDAITRAEATRIINAMLGRSADKTYVDTNLTQKYKDVTSSNEFYYDIMEASVAHEYTVTDGVETWTKLK